MEHGGSGEVSRVGLLLRVGICFCSQLCDWPRVHQLIACQRDSNTRRSVSLHDLAGWWRLCEHGSCGLGSRGHAPSASYRAHAATLSSRTFSCSEEEEEEESEEEVAR